MGISENFIDGLKERFESLQRRCLSVIDQLSDDDVNWSANLESNSITNIVNHMAGSIHQRIETVFSGVPNTRDRDKEFEKDLVSSKEEVKQHLEKCFSYVIECVNTLNADSLEKKPFVLFKPMQGPLNNNSTMLELFMHTVTHFSEHAGQILYIAKLRLEHSYITTTLPKKRST